MYRATLAQIKLRLSTLHVHTHTYYFLLSIMYFGFAKSGTLLKSNPYNKKTR